MKLIKNYFEYLNEQENVPPVSITAAQKAQMESQAEDLIRNYFAKLNEFSLLTQHNNPNRSDQKIAEVKQEIMDCFTEGLRRNAALLHNDLSPLVEDGLRLLVNLGDYLNYFDLVFDGNIIKREITEFEPGYFMIQPAADGIPARLENFKVVKGSFTIADSTKEVGPNDAKIKTGKIENSLAFRISYENGIPKISGAENWAGNKPKLPELKVEG